MWGVLNLFLGYLTLNKRNKKIETMPEQLETLTLGENELRLETLTLPNGNTYTLGCSFEEAQDIYEILSGNIEAVNEDVEDLVDSQKVIARSLNDLNSRIVALTQENASLRGEIAELRALINGA